MGGQQQGQLSATSSICLGIASSERELLPSEPCWSVSHLPVLSSLTGRQVPAPSLRGMDPL